MQFQLECPCALLEEDTLERSGQDHAVGQQSARVNVDVTAHVADQELITGKQCGERVGYGPHVFDHLQSVSHRRAIGRRRTTAHLHDGHRLREHGCEARPEGVRFEVLVEGQGDPFAIRGHPHGESVGEGHLEPGIESLCVSHGKPAASERALDEDGEVTVAHEAGITILRYANGQDVPFSHSSRTPMGWPLMGCPGSETPCGKPRQGREPLPATQPDSPEWAARRWESQCGKPTLRGSAKDARIRKPEAEKRRAGTTGSPKAENLADARSLYQGARAQDSLRA